MNKNSRQEPVNKKFPLPSKLLPLFSNAPDNKIDRLRLLGKVGKLAVKEENNGFPSNPKIINSFLYKDNFILGSLWGLLSGYCTKSFFLTSNYEKSMLLFQTITNPGANYNAIRTGLIVNRIVRRIFWAGLLFDFVEQHASKRLNHSTSNTMSLFAALTASTMAFKLCNKPMANAVYTSAILGGYLLGAKLPELIRRRN